MTQPVRSLRLTGRNSQSLDNITGSSGEIFYDRTLNCLRLYSGAANSSGGEKIADRDWVQSQNYLTSVSWSQVTNKPTLFSGDYNNLTNKPTLFSGNYNDLTNKPAPVSLDGLASESYVTTALSNFIPPTPTSLSNMQGIGFEFGATVDEFSSDPTFTDNSNSAVPTESAVRAYLDRRLGRDAEGTVIAVEAKIGPEYAVTDSPTFTGTVNLAGNLEVTGLTSLSYQTISPAGTTQTDAAAITANLVMILNTAPSGGIRLPASQPYGTRILVRNSAASSRSVYPPTGEEVQGAGAVNSAISQTGLSWREYIKTANPLGTGADWWWALTPT